MRRELEPGELPPCVTRRLISLRAYDRAAMMIEASVTDGVAVGAALDDLFADRAIAYVHLHNARRGCYSCRASRVG
jgi:hypothetical protein